MDQRKNFSAGKSHSQLKHFVYIFSPALFAVAFLLGTFHFITLRSEKAIIEAHELSHVYDGNHTIRVTLQQITTDLMLIAHSPILQHYLKNPSDHLLEKLGEEYLNLATNKKIYDQVRFLDESGMEIVRVNYNGGAPRLVTQEKLQNKKKRYYFADTFSLDSGEIFVSPLDLNIEQGEVEIPYKPMIRFGSPVYDDKGHKRGIVLLNYFAAEMLASVKETMSAEGHGYAVMAHASGRHETDEIYGHPVLLNQQGYWLLGLQKEDEWGFMFGNDRTFAKKFPSVWQHISRSEKGQFEVSQGLFTFLTLYPLSEGQVSATGSPYAFRPSEKKLGRKEYSWKLVSFIDREIFDQVLWQYRRKTAALFAAFFFILVPACRHFADVRFLRQQAENMVRRYEFIVNSSTDFMTLIDSNYRYLAASSSFCQALQKDRQDIVGKSMAEVWGEEIFFSMVKGRFDQALAGEEVAYSTWFDTPQYGKRCYDVTMTSLKQAILGEACCVIVSRDMTETKIAQDALRRAKQDWERTFDAVPDLIAILDDKFRFVQVNKAMADGLGLSPAECIGQTCYELVHGMDGPHLDCPHAQLLQDGMVHEAEVNEKRIGGDYLVTTSPLHESDGTLYGSVHVARDISASKLARWRLEQLNSMKEQLLFPAELSDKLKQITDSVVHIFKADFARIWLIEEGDLCDQCFHAVDDDSRHLCVDRDRCLHLKVSSGRYTHIDGEVHRRVPYGCYKIGRIASQEDTKFLTNDVVHDHRVHDHDWARELGLQSFAGYRLMTQEGKPMGVFAIFSQTRISDEEDVLLEGVAATAAQVIRTALVEEEIRQTRDSLQAIVDNVDAMIYIIDIVTYEIVMANAYVHRQFGDVEGKSCWQVLQKGQDSICEFCQGSELKDFDETLFEPNIWELQNTVNGRWYECRDRVVRWFDNRFVRVQIATDVTERRETREKLEEFAATQKTLLREVNHRVKNNLSAIIGMLHMEEERAHEGESSYGEILHDLVSRIQGLSTVHSLLSAGEWKPIPLTSLCREIVRASLSAVPHEKKVDFEVEETSATIGSTQAHHLALVLNELATNTVKHALGDKDSVQINVKIDETAGGMIKISFQDNGPGYPEELVSGDMRRANVGLEIIQGIISSNLQGTVDFANENGAVTRFSFLGDRFLNGESNDN